MNEKEIIKELLRTIEILMLDLREFRKPHETDFSECYSMSKGLRVFSKYRDYLKED